LRRQTALVAEEAGLVVGFVTFGPSEDEPLDPGTGQVYAIYVDPTHWGHGYGRTLFTSAVRGLKGAGFKDAMLWVLATNDRAKRFYEIAGWRPDGGIKLEERGQALLNEVRYSRVIHDEG
jgi:ribosomal protein S18 acetylase RimI-like enzyme